MEATAPTFIQEYFGEYGIMGSIIVILLFIIGFMYLRQKYPKMTLTKDVPEETPTSLWRKKSHVTLPYTIK